MPMLTHWFGLFGSKLEEEWEDEHPAEAALDRYMESRRYCAQMLRKYPRAAGMIREIDLEDYRKYVRRMLELGTPEIIKQFEDL